MKKTIYFFAFLISSFTFSSCTPKESEEPKLPEWSKCTALKNSEIWVTEAVAYLVKKHPDSIVIQANAKNEFGYLRESIVISLLPIKVGKNTLFQYSNLAGNSGTATYTTLSADGDVIEDRYMIFEEEDNYFNISSYTSDTTEITGQFQMTFVRHPSDPISNYSLADTIRLTNGIARLFVLKLK